MSVTRAGSSVSQKQTALEWHIFCKVIDNYGDIGVCWRLALQLRQQNQQVYLWVDDLDSFQAICPELSPHLPAQILQGITAFHWQEHLPSAGLQQLKQAQVIIEAFACELPQAVVEVMQQQQQQVCWLNLEYLTAELWAQDCHLLPSPVHGLQKYFFFPGFTAQTGGLLWEQELLALPNKMQSLQAREQLFLELGVPLEHATKELQVSLFAYENTQVFGLLEALNRYHKSTHLLVPQGRIQQQVEHWQSTHALQSLTISIVPFMPQPTYDRLLASCQLNFVRGEESFVRAQMLGLPMLWHIYQQQEGAHLIKLEAFLDVYLSQAPQALQATLRQLFRHWNQPEVSSASWLAALEHLSQWQQHAQEWQQQQIQHGNLAQNLVQFAQTRYSAAHF